MTGRMRWLRPAASAVVGVALLGTLGWLWYDSLLPSTYSVMDVGQPDYGGGSELSHGDHSTVRSAATSVVDLTGDTAGVPDLIVELTARRESFTLPSGERIAGLTFNHLSPGPLIRVGQGELLQVTLVNESVSDGVTLHWHGVEVPNAADGVAGVTQDAVPMGDRFGYRFRPDHAGTYWYHSHQQSHVQVAGGLFGVLVVDPPSAPANAGAEFVATVHTYNGRRTVAGRSGTQRVVAAPGATIRVRIVDTDNGPVTAGVSGAAFRVVAVDGRDVNRPTEVRDASVVVAAGGRADLALTVPTDGTAARVDLGGGAVLAVGPPTAALAAASQSSATVDLLTYGSPAPLGFDPGDPNRRFEYGIGRRPGFLDGTPGFWWSINGHHVPDVPMFTVALGDVVVMTITNSSGQLHPMHLHGHHAVVLERNGQRATGSPWWTDSLDVKDGDTYVVAFVGNNPGIWMDHCHNLDHAAQGLSTHLVYSGISEPYRIGGSARNRPE